MSALTITEKILARASGHKTVSPGDIVNAKVHKIMTMDLLGPATFRNFKKLGATKVWDPDRIIMIFDHMVPPPDVASAELHKASRAAIAEYGITHFYDVGRQGLCHQIMPEQGHVLPGTVVVGTDAHSTTFGAVGAFATGVGVTDGAVVFATGELWLRVPESIRFDITGELQRMVMAKDVILYLMGEMKLDGHCSYRAMEFSGPSMGAMSIASRMTMCNMVADMGAKNGIVASDQKTIEYLKERTNQPFEVVRSDLKAEYEETIDIEVSSLEPQVACPHKMDNVKQVTEVEGTPVDQVVLGSCTNGRLEDLEIAAHILQNRKIDPKVRMLVFPASQDVYSEATRKGLVTTFLKANALICPPTCGPCAGRAMGPLADGEVAISTTNRNFKGRMGSPNAQIYLSSPSTAAASAIEGAIADPRKYA
jgi:3-isopropylmalate/(R)-2-methylmalate dehydratase large subunit